MKYKNPMHPISGLILLVGVSAVGYITYSHINTDDADIVYMRHCFGDSIWRVPDDIGFEKFCKKYAQEIGRKAADSAANLESDQITAQRYLESR